MILKRHGLGLSGSGIRVALAALLLIAVAVCVLGFNSHPPTASVSAQTSDPVFFAGKPSMASAKTLLSGLPLVFEANRGQTDPQVRYLARGDGYGLYLSGKEAVLTLQSSATHSSVVRMRMARAAENPEISGVQPLRARANYFVGNDPAKWQRDIPMFGRVRYSGVYPGVDLVYYGRQGRLEYDFEVAPNADPNQIALVFDGADRLSLGADGELVLDAGGANVRLQAPHVYQKRGSEEQSVEGRFVLLANNEVGFQIGSYDRSQALVIDPVLTYSSYFGGPGDEACTAITGSATAIPGCPAIAVDSLGNAYIAGSTKSPTLPGATGSLTGVANVFIAKLDTAQSGSAQLIFATFLGGDGTDTTAGLAVDAALNVIVGGNTTSTNFPAATGFQTSPKSAGQHAFLTKLDQTGGAVLYSTYVSGSATDTATGLAIDTKGNAYLSGTTQSVDFPVSSGAFQGASQANIEFFWTKLNVATTGSSSFVYSTYFGGGNPSTGAIANGGGIAIDSGGNVYITGGTNFLNTGNGSSTDFPILNATQKCLDTPVNPSGTCSVGVAATDAFVAKFSPATNAPNQYQLVYSTYLGGSGNDSGSAIAVDTGGSAYITGSTTSTDFVIPTTAAPFQNANAGGGDAFVAKLAAFTATSTSSSTVAFSYFSYLGGASPDAGTSIAVDSIGGAFVVGQTASSNFPPGTGFLGGASDGFFGRLDTTATTSVAGNSFTRFVGGSGADAATSVAIGVNNTVYLAGETFSPDVATLNPFQAASGGASDTFLMSFGPSVNLSIAALPVPTPTPSPVGVGNKVTFNYTITNNGDAIPAAIFTDILPNGDLAATATGTGATCSTPTPTGGGSVTIICPFGAMDGGGATRVVNVSTTPSAAGQLSNRATITVPGCSLASCTASVNSPIATVTDFTVSAQQPATQSKQAGDTATYTVDVAPVGGNFPQSISLGVSSLPTGATLQTIANNPISNLNSGPQSRMLVISTTARTTTTTKLWRNGQTFYAAWLPVTGFALLGVGFGRKLSRKKRVLSFLLLGGFFALVIFQAGCGSKGSTTTTTGTPAGTYPLVVTATSGTISRTTSITLIVQ